MIWALGGLVLVVIAWKAAGPVPVLATLAVLIIAAVWARLDRFFRRYPHAWRWVSGHPMDGYHRTNATWLRRSHGDRPVLHPTGHAVRWHHWPRLWRAGIRAAGTLGAAALGWLLFTRRQVTLDAGGAAAGLAVVAVAWRVHRLQPVHHFRWVRPARRAVTTELGTAPAAFKVARDRSQVTIGLPSDRVLGANEQKALEYVATERLAICATPTWKQSGGSPVLILNRVEPPPSLVTWADLEAAVGLAGPDELIVGIGADRKIVKVSLTQDSPHFAISAGSGFGKSNLVAFWLLQELRRGAIALILDAKWMSHPWVFKDMDAEYGQLPCVRYCRRTEDIHDALCWLDGEIDRRSQVADRIVNARGDFLRQLGTVGPRMWVVAEEMNMATPRLKDYWAAIRQKGQPARSPALKGFAATSQGGRALNMHEMAVAQMMTALSTGGGDVRENFGVRCLGRYTLNSWKMLAGDLPMPPSVTAPGRVQCVVGPDVIEAQTPLMDLECVREMVMDSDMTPVPHDMPGIASDVLRPTVLPVDALAIEAPDQGIDLGNPRPPGTVTLREAVEGGLLKMKLETAQRASTRPGWPPDQGKDGRAYLYRISDLEKVGR